MSNLRQMIDGVGSLQLNVIPEKSTGKLKVGDDAIIRRQANRSGAKTSEVIVGRILAFGDNQTAEVSILKPGRQAQRAVVSIKELAPVTAHFRRQSIQFLQGFRGRV